MISRPLLRRIALVAAVTIVALAGGGCATRPVAAPDAGVVTRPAAHAVLRSLAIDRALEDRILALDPEQVTADDVRDTLAKGPAPRIILLHGGIYPVYLMMESAGRLRSPRSPLGVPGPFRSRAQMRHASNQC